MAPLKFPPAFLHTLGLHPGPTRFGPGVLHPSNAERDLTVVYVSSWDGVPPGVLAMEGYEQRSPAGYLLHGNAAEVTSVPRPNGEVGGAAQQILGVRTSQLLRDKQFLPIYDNTTEQPLSVRIQQNASVMAALQALGRERPSVISAYKSAPGVRDMARAAGLHLLGANEGLGHLGDKHWAGILFKAAGVLHPLQTSSVTDLDAFSREIAGLLAQRPNLQTVMVKHIDNTSGNGVAPLDVSSISAAARADTATTAREIRKLLMDPAKLQPNPLSHAEFVSMFDKGVVAQEFIPYTVSPSGQGFIDGAGNSQFLSASVQVLEDGKIYKGATSGAPGPLQPMIAEATEKIAAELAKRGISGHFGVDFLALPVADGKWELYACEINIRRLGTNHPMEMMTALFGGGMGKDGFHHAADGARRAFEVSDNLGVEGLDEAHRFEPFRGMPASDLFDLALRHGMLAGRDTPQGVWPLMTVSLGRYGKSGALAFAPDLPQAQKLLKEWKRVLTEATRDRRPPKPGPLESAPAQVLPSHARRVSRWLRDAQGERSDFIRSAAFSPDGTFVAAGINMGTGSSLRVHDLRGLEKYTLTGFDSPVRSVTATKDLIAAGFADGSARVFRASDGKALFARAGAPGDGMVNDVALSADGTRVATASHDGTARVLDVASGVELARVKVDGWARSVAFNPDGRLWVADENAGAKLFDLSAPEAPVLELGNAGAQQVAVSPDGRYAAVRFVDGSAELWDVQARTLQQRFARDWPVQSLSWLPGEQLALGFGDDTLHFWDVARKGEVKLVAREAPETEKLARQQWSLGTVHREGDTYSTVSADGQLHRWGLQNDAASVP